MVNKRNMEISIGNEIETKYFEFEHSVKKLLMFYSDNEMKEKAEKTDEVLVMLDNIKEILEWI